MFYYTSTKPTISYFFVRTMWFSTGLMGWNQRLASKGNFPVNQQLHHLHFLRCCSGIIPQVIQLIRSHKPDGH